MHPFLFVLYFVYYTFRTGQHPTADKSNCWQHLFCGMKKKRKKKRAKLKSSTALWHFKCKLSHTYFCCWSSPGWVCPLPGFPCTILKLLGCALQVSSPQSHLRTENCCARARPLTNVVVIAMNARFTLAFESLEYVWNQNIALTYKELKTVASLQLFLNVLKFSYLWIATL